MLLILIIILNEAKANIARHAIAALAVVLRGLPLTTEAELARLAMVEALAEIYDLVDGSGIFMTQAASDRVFELANEFLILYNFVCQHSLVTGAGAYNFVTKHHFFYHIAFFARYQNPRCTWCYGFENFVGRVQDIAESCTRGTKAHKVPRKVVQNLLYVMSAKLRGV